MLRDEQGDNVIKERHYSICPVTPGDWDLFCYYLPESSVYCGTLAHVWKNVGNVLSVQGSWCPAFELIQVTFLYTFSSSNRFFLQEHFCQWFAIWLYI